MRTEYQTVFVITQKGFQWWFPAFGLIPIVIGVLLLYARVSAQTQDPKVQLQALRLKFRIIIDLLFPVSDKTERLWEPWIYIGFGVFWILFVFMVTYSFYYNSRQAFLEGQYLIVEGKVENFRSTSYTGRVYESFTVNGVRFGYSNLDINPGFSNVSSDGGPIRGGLQVRIHYLASAHMILKLEIMQ